jgi:single-strand DNA-binding protein
MSKITVSGLVATTPRHLVTQEGLPITSFRLASEIDGATNWYTITSFKALAINSAISISKGDRVILVGDLRVRDWDNGERAGTSVEIEATTIGHDLFYGSSVFTRTSYASVEAAKVSEPAEDQPANHSCTCRDCAL